MRTTLPARGRQEHPSARGCGRHTSSGRGCGQRPPHGVTTLTVAFAVTMATASGEVAVLGQLDVGLRQLLDVDVLEGHDPDVLDETGRAVDVPDPRVGHRHVEEDLSAVAAHLEVDRVGEVEAALRLDDVGEETDDVAV